MKKENADSWNSGPKMSKSEIPILHNFKYPETLRRNVLEYIKNIGRRKIRRGPTRWPQAWRRAPWACRPPGHPPVYIFCYMKGFDLEKKNHKKTFGTKRRRLGAEPGQKQSRAPAERFCRGNFPPGGGNRSHRHHQRSSHRGRTNLHQHLHQHHLLSNPSSSLVFNLCIKTLDWYLWVASSVDYSS